MKEETKKILTQQVAVPKDAMRLVKIYAASNYMSITATIERAIEQMCGDIKVVGEKK
jgi:hypothetical protein